MSAHAGFYSVVELRSRPLNLAQLIMDRKDRALAVSRRFVGGQCGVVRTELRTEKLLCGVANSHNIVQRRAKSDDLRSKFENRRGLISRLRRRVKLRIRNRLRADEMKEQQERNQSGFAILARETDNGLPCAGRIVVNFPEFGALPFPQDDRLTDQPAFALWDTAIFFDPSDVAPGSSVLNQRAPLPLRTGGRPSTYQPFAIRALPRANVQAAPFDTPHA